MAMAWILIIDTMKAYFQLPSAVADKDTIWPEGFDPVAAGVTFD